MLRTFFTFCLRPGRRPAEGRLPGSRLPARVAILLGILLQAALLDGAFPPGSPDVLLPGLPVAEAARAQMTAQETYELGMRYLKRGSTTKALEQFNRVRTYFRDDPYALKAELAIADVQYDQNEWDAARLAYEDFLRAHPRYPELDYVVFRLGMTCYKKAPQVAGRDQTWTRQAVNTWAAFGSRFPESAHRAEAEEMLGKARNRLAKKEFIIADFYADREAWPAVVGRLEGLLRQYPDAEIRLEVLSLIGVAYARTDRMDLATGALDRLAEEAPGSREHRELARELGQ